MLPVVGLAALGPGAAAFSVWRAAARPLPAAVAATAVLSVANVLPVVAAVWLAGRYLVLGRRWARRLAVHLAAVAVVAPLVAAAGAAAHALVPAVGAPFTPAAVVQQTPNYILIALVAHAVLLVRRTARARAARQRLGRSLARAGRAQAAAELRAVKAELHPALVARTLESARALVRADPSAAERLVVQLGALMRDAVADAGVDEVALDEELEAARARGSLADPDGRGAAASALALDVDATARALLVPHLVLPAFLACADEAGWRGVPLTLRARAAGDGRLALTLWPRGDAPDAPGARPNGGPGDAVGAGPSRANSAVTSLRRQLAHLYGADAELAWRVPGGPAVGPAASPAVQLTLPVRAADAPARPRARSDERRLEEWVLAVAGARPGVRGVGADSWLVGALGAFLTGLLWWDVAARYGAPWATAAPLVRGAAAAASILILAVAAVAATRRWPIGVVADGGRAVRAHALVGLATAAACAGLRAAAEWGARGAGVDLGQARPGGTPAGRVATAFLLYGVLAGAAHVVVLGRERRYAARLVRELRAARGVQARDRASSELRALKAELNPHFVGNALHTAAALVRRDPDAAADVLGALGALADAAGARLATQEVPLAEELLELEPFLALERARLGAAGGTLIVEWDVAPGVAEAAVPHLVLQPLAENAVRHGLAPRGGAGRLVVGARRAGPQLELTVRDDGVGLTAARVAGDPRSATQGGTAGGVVGGIGSGAGLGGVRRRLALLYGARATCVLEPAPGGGTVARLTLPFRLMPAPGESADVPAAAGG